MKHDDAFSQSLFDASAQAKGSTALSTSRSGDMAIKQATNPPTTLAPVQRFETSQLVAEKAENVTAPLVDNFLPVPKRWLVFGGLGLIGVLGGGALALTALPHRTMIKAKATVQPTVAPQLLQSGNGGTVKSLFVQNYDVLAAEQVIASFENSALYAELENIQSSINQTKQQIVNLDEEIVVLQQRQTDGNWLGLEVSQNQFEYSRSLLLEHQSELQQELAEQQLLLKNVQQRIDAMTIQSPIAGTLYDLEIRNVGQTIQANEPIAKVIPADTPLQIKALVSEAEANSIRVGLPTQIHLDSCTYSNFGILEGEVKSVESVTPQTAETFVTVDTANTNQHIVTVEATTDPTETNAQTCKLLPGTKGQINIIAKQERVLTFFLRKLRFSNNV